MINTNDKDTAEQSTPQFNNAKPSKTKSTLNNKILFEDASALPPHSQFRILSHRIAPDSTSNGYSSTGKNGTSNRTLKRCLVTLYIAKNNNIAITVGRAFNLLMKLMHVIEGDSNKVKISPWKIKQPNLEFVKYIKGGKYPKVEVGKCGYDVIEVQSR